MDKDKETELKLEIKELEHQIPRLRNFLSSAYSYLMKANNIIGEHQDEVHRLVDNMDLHDGEADFWAITYGEAFSNAMEARIEEIKEDLP